MNKQQANTRFDTIIEVIMGLIIIGIIMVLFTLSFAVIKFLVLPGM
jgi:hypothetical protein